MLTRRSNNNRNNRRNSVRRLPSGATVPSNQLARVNDQLHEMVQLEKTQQDMSIPRVLDVPRMNLKRDKVYTFSRSQLAQQLVTSATDTGVGLQFSLSAVVGSSDFTNLFEQYRIVQVNVKFVPVVAGSTSTVTLYTWIDQDDANPPTSIGDGLQSETFQISAPNKYFERTFTPHAASPVYNTASVFTAFSSVPTMQWMDNAYSTIVYYGLKIFYNPTAFLPANTVLYNVFQDVIIQCRRPL